MQLKIALLLLQIGLALMGRVQDNRMKRRGVLELLNEVRNALYETRKDIQLLRQRIDSGELQPDDPDKYRRD